MEKALINSAPINGPNYYMEREKRSIESSLLKGRADLEDVTKRVPKLCGITIPYLWRCEHIFSQESQSLHSLQESNNDHYPLFYSLKSQTSAFRSLGQGHKLSPVF